jgi:hypothetical protein
LIADSASPEGSSLGDAQREAGLFLAGLCAF